MQGTSIRLWNRMSSGSYFPGPVRAVEIPKKGKQGGMRVLGIPNVADRIAQTAAAMALEPGVEPVFHEDSYGYRPGRRPWTRSRSAGSGASRSDWVVDLDIRAFFDSVPWDLMLKAVGAPHRPAMGRAVRGALAEGPDADGPTEASSRGSRARRKESPISPLPRQLVPALRARCVDGAGVPGHPVRALCRRCGVPLRQRTPSPARAGRGRASAGRGRAGAPPRQDAGSCTARTASAAETYERDLVHVLRLHVPAAEGVQPAHGGGLHRLPTGGLPGQADGDEPPGCILAASSTHDLTLDDLAAGDQPRAAGMARLLHRVLPERGDPTLRPHRSPSGALGEVEVQAAGTQRPNEHGHGCRGSAQGNPSCSCTGSTAAPP